MLRALKNILSHTILDCFKRGFDLYVKEISVCENKGVSVLTNQPQSYSVEEQLNLTCPTLWFTLLMMNSASNHRHTRQTQGD
jgi:hypothetical protein